MNWSRAWLDGVLCTTALLAARPAAGAALGSLDGFDVRLDTTLRLSAGFRTEAADAGLLDNVNADDGDRAFAAGPISERVDVTSQLDVTRGELGFELSADGWYDAAYHGTDANRSPATFNPVSVAYDRFPADVERLMGDMAELQNAYLHDRLEIAGLPVSLRVGRQAVIWGESLFFAQDGIAAGQAPVDLIKAASQPLIEARELFLPVTQADLRVGLPWHLSLEAYDQFEWRRDRIPGVASFFSTSDVLDVGGERLFTAAGALVRGRDRVPSGAGQFGAALRFSTDALDVGFYGLRYDAKLPDIELGASASSYRLAYPAGIVAAGVSASAYVGDDAVAGELSWRANQPLASRFQPFAPAATKPASAVPDAASFATGDTLQALASLERQIRPGALWDGASLQAELAATDVLAVRTGSSSRLPGTTPAALAIQAVFAPTYYHVARDLVLSLPLGLELGLAGRSSVDPGRDAGTGNLTVGAAATYRSVWQARLTFTHFVGPPKLQPLADRDFVLVSVEKTF